MNSKEEGGIAFMEWNRPTRPAQQAAQPAASTTGQVSHASHGGKKRGGSGFSLQTLSAVILLFSATILAVVVIGFIMFNNKRSDERRFVDTKKMQAVFLNGGQVYFGHISNLNNGYVRLNNIYYLRVNQQVQPDQKDQKAQQQDISLVKLGCELHGPADEMLINRDQVVFWENLKDDGQVAKAVAEYIKANPDGQKCQTNNQQNSNSSNGQTTPTTNSSNKQNP